MLYVFDHHNTNFLHLDHALEAEVRNASFFDPLVYIPGELVFTISRLTVFICNFKKHFFVADTSSQ